MSAPLKPRTRRVDFGTAIGLKKALVVPFVLLLPALFACSPRSARESGFDRFLSSYDTNARIALRPISTEATESLMVSVSVQLTNNSSQSVGFPPGYGARGFLWSDEGRSWSEISNEIVFPEVGY